MTELNVIKEERDQLLFLTINRESKLNALNKATLAELAEAIKAANTNDSIRAVILTGSGQKAFVAGADIAEFRDYDEAQGRQLAEEGQKNVFDAIEQSTKPFIAAINGFALGGGLELAMACHIRIASENARLGLPEVGLGLIPGYGGTQRLTQLVGKGHAFQLITTGDMITAEVAERIGLVNHTVPLEELMEKATEIAQKIKGKAPLAVAGALRAVNAVFEDGVNGYKTEISVFGACFGTADFKEGTHAFLEKRKPSFTGK